MVKAAAHVIQWDKFATVLTALPQDTYVFKSESEKKHFCPQQSQYSRVLYSAL